MKLILRRFCNITKTNILAPFGIKVSSVYRNLQYYFIIRIPQYYELGLITPPKDPETFGTVLSQSGALLAYSGQKIDDLSSQKRIVKDGLRQIEINWGKTNIPLQTQSYTLLQDLAINYFNTRQYLYVVDGYVGWDPDYRMKVRLVCTRAYHAFFMHNMLIKPTKQQLQTDFKAGADYYIFNAGQFHSNSYIKGITSSSTSVINFQKRSVVILGTQYAGQMKSAISKIMNYLMMKKGFLPIRCGANQGLNGKISLFVGFQGQGKTTLASDEKRKFLGNDFHIWRQFILISDIGIFNCQGGCYPKVNNLTQKDQKQVYNAFKFGTLVQNASFQKQHHKRINFFDTSISSNIRACYPLQFIHNSKLPARGSHPQNIFLLVRDGYGILPPIAQLTLQQAVYYYLSGYYCRASPQNQLPQIRFSSCYLQNLLPFSPIKYAQIFKQKIQIHNTKVWLLNLGQIGQGKDQVIIYYQTLPITVAKSIVDAIHKQTIFKQKSQNYPVFNVKIPLKIQGVQSSILNPSNNWKNKQTFETNRKLLVQKFLQNFKRLQGGQQITKKGGPMI